jgi:hypothetical protein
MREDQRLIFDDRSLLGATPRAKALALEFREVTRSALGANPIGAGRLARSYDDQKQDPRE